MSSPPAFRSGFVALVGRPNVGKSTLTNALVGQKVAIVTPKPQTTRIRLHAIVNRPSSQIVLVDTPGVTKALDALRRAMRGITSGAAADADVTLLVVEVRGERPHLADADREVIEVARRGAGSLVLAINKVDQVRPKDLLLPWMELFARELGTGDETAIVPISARTGDGLEALMGELERRLPEGPPLFPPEVFTDQIERVLCAELVREQVLLQTEQEVPHSAAVVIDSFEDDRDEEGGLCRLEGRILVERESQKGIVVGKGGAMIKAVSAAARQEIEELLGCQVYLRLTVQVDKDWRRNEQAVRRLGYGLPKE